MNDYAEKIEVNKIQNNTGLIYQNKSNEDSTLQLADNRQEAASQRELQDLISSSPRTLQLRSFQDMADNRPHDKAIQLQDMANNYIAQKQLPIQKKENNTGLPDNLKSGIENISGYAMDDVKVHYNSTKPAQLNAHAYAQGTDIHLGSGQEKHLPHEAWHVVQQKQGRVKPTKQMKAKVGINDDVALEKEADVMGMKSFQFVNMELEYSDNYSLQNNSITSSSLQRKISYEAGQYTSEEELLNALYSIFEPPAWDSIEIWVNKYSVAKGRANFASTVYQYIIGHLADEGFIPSFATTSTTNESSHGPMIPDRVNRNADVDLDAAIGTFNFSSVTLGRLTLINEKVKISFQDRQLNVDFHAEDGLLEQLKNYIKTNNIEEDTSSFRLNLTINNFFCTKHSTGKKDKGNNCLCEIIKLQDDYKFAGFHVYFQNPYGDREKMTESINRLQSAGISVTAFTTTDDAPYANDELDSQSESEDEHKSDMMNDSKEKTKNPAKAFESDLNVHEQKMASFLLNTNNCLINAIARGGLGRNANIGEIVNIRLELRERGFPIGDMLVASPQILDIIRNTLGINRGIIVHYQNTDFDSDTVDGPNAIIIDHDNAHFEERKIVKAKKR